MLFTQAALGLDNRESRKGRGESAESRRQRFSPEPRRASKLGGAMCVLPITLEGLLPAGPPLLSPPSKLGRAMSVRQLQITLEGLLPAGPQALNRLL